MLAEPKSRTVWTLNPRGKFWSEDKSKLGQKLLESMGWSEGKGLGKLENGIKDNIKVGFKCDNKGLGFKSTPDDEWISNNNSYEEILAHLALHHNNGSNVETKVSNLEEKSKMIRNRVHYNKFIRAKNLSQCTQKDLSSIFPKKKQNSDNENESSNKLCAPTSATSTSTAAVTENSNDSKTFESCKNMNEYFKSKMERLKIKSQFLNKNDSTGLENNISQENIGLEDVPVIEEEVPVSEEEVPVSEEEEVPVSEEKDVILDDNCYHSKLKKLKHKNAENLKSKAISEELVEKSDLFVNEMNSKKNKRKKEKKLNNSLTIGEELYTQIDNNLNDDNITKQNKSKKSKKQKKSNIESESLNDSQVDKKGVHENGTDEKIVESRSPMKSKYSKNSKYKIRLPTGYEKSALSVSDSLKNYHKICDAIAKDKTLNTTNLISLHGYGYETDLE